MQQGSFLVLLQRQSSLPSWLPFWKTGSDDSFSNRCDDLLRRVEKSCKANDVGRPATPLKFQYPGAVGVVLQEKLQVAGGLSHRKQPACFSSKKAAVVFQGYLTNLDELIEDLLYGKLPEPGTSYEAEYGRANIKLKTVGDQVTLSAEVILHMFLRTSHDYDLPVLLSELQGQFSFAIFDSNKRQIFAARDASGKEPLFIKHEEDGMLAITNVPTPAWKDFDSKWQEVLPGHYIGGRNPKQIQQFALTPHQLHMREYAECVEELSTSQKLHSLSGVVSQTGEPILNKDDRSSSSIHSSTELDKNLDHLFRISV